MREREKINIGISEFMPEGYMSELSNLSLVTSHTKIRLQNISPPVKRRLPTPFQFLRGDCLLAVTSNRNCTIYDPLYCMRGPE